MQKVNSAYTKTETETLSADENLRNFIESSNVLYLDKKRTSELLRTIGNLQPYSRVAGGSIGSITYSRNRVKIEGVPFSEVVTQNQRLYLHDVAIEKESSATADKRSPDIQYQARVGTTYDNIPVYESDVDQSLSLKEKQDLYKERIATVINLGGIVLKTDTKRIAVRGDRFTADKNVYGTVNEGYNARLDALYDTAEMLSNSKYVQQSREEEMEPSYANPAQRPKNKAHKGVKYWYKFKNTVILDGELYDVIFNIRDKGKEQYEYLIEFHHLGQATKKTDELQSRYSYQR